MKDIRQASASIGIAIELLNLARNLLDHSIDDPGSVDMAQLDQAIAAMPNADHFISNAGQAMLKARGEMA